MKRRRFITFGSILAVALSLATVGYLMWFAVWHNTNGTDFSRAIVEGHWGADRICVYDGNRLHISWTVTGPCMECGESHGYWVSCDGIEIKAIRPNRFSHIWNPGPILYTKQAAGRLQIHDLRIESWLPITVLAAYPALYFLIVGIRRRRRRPGHCLHCDYDLTGNESGVCPECGTAVYAEHKN